MGRVLTLAVVVSMLFGPSPEATDQVSKRVMGEVVHQVEPAEPRHTPPVDAPIIDPFRLPPEPWMAGNRGIEYDTTPGQVVRASAAGVVTFAGQVGGQLFVTIQHDSTLRTTVGFVDEVLVVPGELIASGQPIAVSGESLHFSARRGDRYIDPEGLFGRVRVVVRLVPGVG